MNRRKFLSLTSGGGIATIFLSIIPPPNIFSAGISKTEFIPPKKYIIVYKWDFNWWNPKLNRVVYKKWIITDNANEIIEICNEKILVQSNNKNELEYSVNRLNYLNYDMIDFKIVDWKEFVDNDTNEQFRDRL